MAKSFVAVGSFRRISVPGRWRERSTIVFRSFEPLHLRRPPEQVIGVYHEEFQQKPKGILAHVVGRLGESVPDKTTVARPQDFTFRQLSGRK